jgi:hypothetical protein
MPSKSADRAPESFTIAPQRQRPIKEPFYGKILLQNESKTARARYRIENPDTHEVPDRGELDNQRPDNKELVPIKEIHNRLTIYNESTEASIDVTLLPDPGFTTRTGG